MYYCLASIFLSTAEYNIPCHISKKWVDVVTREEGRTDFHSIDEVLQF